MNFKIFLPIISILLSLFIGENFVKYISFSKEERALGAEGIYNGLKNNYLDDSPCQFRDIITPHPQLGYILDEDKSAKDCNYEASNIGLPKTHDFQYINSDETYDILIVGGSVADLLSRAADDIDNILIFEKYLNDNFISPVGNKFKVLNGAFGGWRQPNQLVLATQYSSLVDAVLVLDGYNELLSYQNTGQIDSPLTQKTYQYQSKSSVAIEEALNSLNELNKNFEKYPFVRKSYIANLYRRNLVNKVASRMKNIKIPSAVNYFDKTNLWNERNSNVENNSGDLIKQFRKYSLLIERISEIEGIDFFHFLQPLRWVGKKLTKVELSYIRHTNDRSVDQYLELEKTFNTVSRVSLLNVFSDVEGTLYHDHIHFNFEGQKLMIKKIAKAIQTKLNLREKEN